MHRTLVLGSGLALAVGLSASACGSDSASAPQAEESPVESTEQSEDRWPDVLRAELEETSPGVFRVSATLSSPYDSPERYADGWRVMGQDGTVYGERPLAHDHAGEQPFTRSVSGVEIPADVLEVTIQGRDQVSGWGGATVTVQVPHSEG